MHPVLFDLQLAGHHVALRSYGVAIAGGFVAGVWLATRAARRAGLDVGKVRDLCFWILVAALAGSRLVYVLANLGEFDGAPWRAVAVWEGGLVFYGGVAAATVAVVVYARWHALPTLAVADVLAPALALGHAIGRVGCYLAGCCFGRETAGALGARFPSESLAHQELVARGLLAHAAERTPPLHPTQLYEAFGELAIFGLLALAARWKRAHGQLAALYLGAYAILRGVVELYRGDQARRFVWEMATPHLNRALGLDPSSPTLLSTSQAGSLIALACAIALALHLRGAARSG